MGCSFLSIFTAVGAFFISCNHCDIVQKYLSYRVEAECQLDVCDDTILPVDDGDMENMDPSLFIPKMMPIGDQCCTKCFCDTQCGRRGDCCPDYNYTMTDNPNIPIGGLYRCTHTNLKKARGFTYLMVSRCLNNFTDDEVRKKCTDESASALEYFLPVTNNYTNETYRNVFCALCNFENTDSLTPWKVNLSCSMNAPFTLSLPTLAQDILTQEGCNLYFGKPKTLQIDSCRDIYDSCNLTGLWPVFDQEIVDACEFYKAEFDDEYRNIFCYICNKPTDKLPKGCDNSIRNEYRPPFPFSVLFDFNSVEEVIQAEEMVDRCPSKAVYNSYLDTCHIIHCDKGYIYQEEECTPNIMGLCRDAYLSFVTSSIPYHDIEVIHQTLERTLEDRLNLSAVGLWDVHVGYYGGNLTFFVLHCRFAYQKDFAQNLIELTKEKFALQYSYFSKDQNQEDLIYFDVKIQDRIPRYVISADLFEDKSVMHAFEIQDLGKADTRSFKESSIDECSLYVELTPMTQFTACPWIEVVLKDFNVSVSETGLIFWDMDVILSNNQFKFKGQDEINILDETEVIVVCVHDFFKNTNENKFAQIIPMSNSESLGYLALATSVLSIVSALFTIITYATFRSLRAQPGINNMILAVHILFGHCFYLFGIRRHFSTVVCSIIGAVSHFSWLSVVLWYFVCSYHMSRVFRFTGNVLQASIPKRTIKYTLFVTVTSLSVMTINIISSLIFSNNGHSGYGDEDAEFCWISRPLFVALTMTLPTLLAVLCNMALFIYTLREIRERSQMNIRSNKNRQTFLIYIKLSALTGITWLAIIPYIFTRLDIFNYIFTCLHGCNGVFLMVAFTLNRRVFSLYKSLCVRPGKKERSSGRTTLSS